MALAQTATDAIDRLSKLLLDSYVETDESIGPRVHRFELAEGQLRLIGEQLTSLRDAASARHDAHVQLAALADSGEAVEGITIPSVRAFGERQEGLARLAQTLAAWGKSPMISP